MAIWMDMTYSLSVWKGGLIGIIRAELEMAKNLHAVNKEIRFCRATMNGYVEIKHGELDWLWNSQKIGDAYLEKMGRNQKESVPSTLQYPDGLKNAYAYSGGRLDRIRQFMNMCYSRVPILLKPLAFVLCGLVYIPIKLLSMTRQLILHGRLVDKGNHHGAVENKSSETSGLKVHPFSEGDMLFCAGWYSYEGIIKEKLISELKNKMTDFRVVYLIYDMVLSNEETSSLYGERERFEQYVLWMMNNCDYMLYGGNTAKSDAERFFKKMEFPLKPSHYIKFGSDLAEEDTAVSMAQLRKKYDIKGDFILSVGTVDAKKNYSTVYHAYTMLPDLMEKDRIPTWVIVGGKYGDPWLSEAMEIDIRIKDKIRFARPTDDELVALYQNCLFTILPTWYEGWSLTLPESLEHGKFCLSSDVAPLREIGADFVEYVEPDDTRAWAEQIKYFTLHPNIVLEKNARIKKEYKPIRWIDCGRMLNEYLREFYERKEDESDRHFYYDLSLVFGQAIYGGHVSGILRTQLLLARNMGRLYPHMKYIAFTDVGYIPINRFLILGLLTQESIDVAFSALGSIFLEMYKRKANIIDNANPKYTNGQIYWMLASLMPGKIRDSMIEYYETSRFKKVTEVKKNATIFELPFQKNDIFFSTGVGFSPEIFQTMRVQKEKIGFKYVQLLYDFTPILFPQVHTKDTRKFYKKFIEESYILGDAIFYGGETAMRDGEEYAKENKLPRREGYPIRFGSNISVSGIKNMDKKNKEIFKKYGIEKEYIMAVGSIEVRKNHETLYLAYLDMIQKYEDVPQMLFCGYPGWKTEEFLKRLHRDERVKDFIKVITPSDEEMDILYRNCLFTVLASLYEGWSLTLPESLNYGKICISTKADPMVEIGGDYLEYVDAFDVKGWSDMIMKYYNDRDYLSKKESTLKNEWKPISWKDCAIQVGSNLKDIYKKG